MPVRIMDSRTSVDAGAPTQQTRSERVAGAVNMTRTCYRRCLRSVNRKRATAFVRRPYRDRRTLYGGITSAAPALISRFSCRPPRINSVYTLNA